MPDYAPWRRTPNDPRTAFGWLWTERRRHLNEAVENLGCLGQLGVVLLFVLGHPLAASGLIFATLLLKPLARLGGKPISVEPLLTLPLPATAFACEIEVRRQGTVIGTDRGVVTFLEGWLQYEGFRTSFSFSRSDVVQRIQNALTLTDGGVAFEPDANVAREFGLTLDRWYRIESAARGISVLPPRNVHRSAFSRAHVGAFMAASKVLVSIAVAFAAASYFHGSFFLLILFGYPLEFLGSIATLVRLRRMVRKDQKALEGENACAFGRKDHEVA